ncbi:MAG: YnfA family protein [Novosphingobium sp.]|uniref:YnfA family protein n=1 Tax=Novosphingobium sp. TaxID=1874826 RepID=UPI001D45F38F|nr:YnfA family protein [Novosphingobium sp.]MCB2057747.1 YnfA family protein [Novosphingobium sp.]MCP5386064.1 YnfA family protein [Novosphingobium sp.]
MKLWALYAAAAFCEIAGCFAFWAWLRNGKPASVAIPGVIALITFAWLLTRVDVAYAGRAYAAYGGIYIVASLIWLSLVEGQRPTGTDIVGALICLAGVAVILAGSGAFSPKA